MRRRAALAVLSVCAGTALAGDAPAADAIRAAAREVLSRPEFRYGRPREKSFLEELWDAFSEGVARFVQSYPTLALWIAGAMAAALLGIVAHIIWTLRTARQARWDGDPAADLDAAIRRGDPAAFRARAVAHAAAGRFDDAVRDLYAALLLTLDRRGALSYAPHKALLDYRIEAARDPAASAALDLFAGTYHPGSFGRRPPDRSHFDDLVRALDAFAERAR